MEISLGETLNKKTPARQDRLNAWLAINRITKQSLADELGVTIQYVSMVMRGERRQKWIIDKLAELGVPAELLPEPSKTERRVRV